MRTARVYIAPKYLHERRRGQAIADCQCTQCIERRRDEPDHMDPIDRMGAAFGLREEDVDGEAKR